MKALYSTYTDEDIIILIPKRKDEEIKVIKEEEFNLTVELEEKYLVFAYCDEYKIFNNGVRHIYDGELKKDLSNLKFLYREDEVCEVGIYLDRYIPVYKRYTKDEILNSINKIIYLGVNFLNKKVEDLEEVFNEGEFLYFYDGEEIELTIYLKGEIEKEISIDFEVLEEIKLLLSSVRKDETMDDWEILNYLLEGILKGIEEDLGKKGITEIKIVECD